MSAHDDVTPAQRLRALELSGDPEAREIAKTYKSNSMTDPYGPAMRQVSRAVTPARDALRPTYARATDADAAEAEEKVAAARARRERERREREEQLHAFARNADRREALMLRLTWLIVLISVVSLATAAAALYVAIRSS